ncbi:glycoside hydrolase family 3 C-terminal domain-containing protein [Naasia sp. SYSU D00948]|uniref:glycoside hydrolase family 3 protein n=1 Tax=Naasia sp. SYSU D00948 TaxID=2817379 RepID=UPI001B306710|nr:glycoside hydrolase family 3 C-terminal domain-containing protein [Naasia sp. SYSU D00948]
MSTTAPRARRRRSPAVASALTALTLLVPAGALGIAGPAAAVDCTTVPWMDTTKSAEERATALLEASTLHQKYRWLNEQAANSPQQTEFRGVVYPAQLECTPTVVYSNGPEGVHGAPGTTAFPGPIAVASTWNLELGYEKGSAQAQEAFDKGSAVVLGPGVASARTPLSGRNAEYFGEDPLLSGLSAAVNIQGMQGNEDKPVLANLKHYVANEQETDREESSSNMDERTLREIYDLPFEIAIKEGDPHSLMCSYNQINGVYACENPILTTHLREDYGFDGYIMSDFGSVHSTAPSLDAGLDQELNRPVWYTPERLDAALAAGEITEEQIDAAAFNVVHAYIEGGLFDIPAPATPLPDVSSEANRAISQQIAEQGSVLLKNDDAVLPLSDEEGLTIAVIGPTASAQLNAEGVSAKSVCSAYFQFRRAGVLSCDHLIDPLTALTERAAQNGQTVLFDDGDDVASAAALAAQADVALVFGYLRTGEFADTPDLRLDGNGDQLVEAVAAANDSTAVVLGHGTAVEMPWIDSVDAVLATWYPGDRMGPAITNLLYGDVNPSGKLPMTFPKSVEDTPTSTPEQYPGIVDANGIRQVEYSEGLQVGYRWYAAQGIEPLFEFGHGLSYTSFDYSHVKVTPQSTDGKKEIRIRFRLTNTGDREGTEVAQAYVELPSSTGEPSKRLVGWERVTLAPGEHANVEIVLSPEDLAELHLLEYWDESAGAWTTATGTYTVTVGGSFDAEAASSFRIR